MRTVLILLAALPLLAAGENAARFHGRVYESDGVRQIANAIVTVSAPGGFITSVTTNNSGEFSFSGLQAGEYSFRVTAHGYAIYERQLTLSNAGGVKQLDIRMVVPADKQTVSVAELRDPIVTRVSYRGY